jgi:Glycosyltransferase
MEAEKEAVHICCFCEKWESGGIESFLTNILSCMDRNGLKIDIVVSQRRENVYEKVLAELGIPLLVLSGSCRRTLKNLRLFRHLLRANHYSAVHLNIYHGLSLLFAWEAKRAGIPLIIAHSHNTGLRPSAGRVLKMALHHFCSRLFTCCATTLWAPSEAAARFMFGAKAFELVPNGIQPERFAFRETGRAVARERLGLERNFVIGSTGRLCWQKNQSFLLEVLARMKNAVLLLVGEGEDLAMLREKAERMGLSGRVIFYGTSNDMPPLYWAMDAFALPSRFEGLGIVAVEAQAAGLYTLCSENVPPEAGVTSLAEFSPLDSMLWAGKLAAAAGMPRADMSSSIRAAGYDVATVSARIRAAYLRGRL